MSEGIEGEIKKVAILGGSFNPPHLGHIKICQYLLGAMRMDEVWVVPCYIHPFGKEMAPYEDRIAMCRFAFQEFKDKVRVSDVEKQLGGVSYTVKTLKYLKEKHPSNQYVLVMGRDVEGEVSDWESMDEIRGLARVVTIPRGPSSFIPDISSTEIRGCIGQGRSFADMVTREVAVYIVTHGLYQ